ncbi:MAG: ribosome biogenesis GTPase YlqF [Peptococcaceae bacterium]|nr:MAG: ribosome biogenesis GTPase YlqF [Peptococcaceae bacterium]
MEFKWYPGHMARARRMVFENLKLVDVVIELVDARVPFSSRNPELKSVLGLKPVLLVMNKADLAEDGLTAKWEKVFSACGQPVVAVNSLHGDGIKKVPVLVKELAVSKMTVLTAAGRRVRAVRCMVIGVPNVGKSSFINRLVGQKAARTGSVPGITRGRQWIRLKGNLELLDTPGVLWPRRDDREVGFKLAVTGAVKEDSFDVREAVEWLVQWLVNNCPEVLLDRYKLPVLPFDTEKLLESIGARRGFYKPGGVVDLFKAAAVLLKEFREGLLGRFTLDLPPE